VVGIDVSLVGLRKAREAISDVEFTLADATRLPYADQSFDMIFCQGLPIFSIDDLSEAKTAGLELLRCLRDDGILVFAHATNLSGKMKGSWFQHRQSAIVDFFPSLGCNIASIYLVERLIMLRLFGRLAINSTLLKHALPVVCRVTGLPICLVVIARKSIRYSSQLETITS